MKSIFNILLKNKIAVILLIMLTPYFFTSAYCNDVVGSSDGTRASKLYENTTSAVVDIWGTSRNRLYVTTSTGELYYFNGFNWKKLDYKRPIFFRSIWGASDSEIFIIGYDSLEGSDKKKEVAHYLFRYDGKNWKIVERSVTSCYWKVWGVSKREIFFLGNDDAENALFHYDGEQIQKFRSLNLQGKPYASFWGTSPNNVFIADGNIVNFNGHSISTVYEQHHELYQSIWGFSQDNIYAAGGLYKSEPIIASLDISKTILFKYPEIKLLHFNGKNWDNLSSQCHNKYFGLVRGIWGTSGDNIYIVTDLELLHYNGTDLQHYDLGEYEPNIRPFFTRMWGNKTDLYLVGAIVLHFDGKTWEVL